MNGKLTKALIALALIGTAGVAAAHDRDDDRGWDRRDHGRHRGWHQEYRGHDRSPWCHEHRMYHRHVHAGSIIRDNYYRRHGNYRSEYFGPYDRDDITIILRGDLR